VTRNNKIGNGSIPLRIGRLIDTTVYGGPYRDVPELFWGVKMAAEINHPHMVDIPTKDFCVPDVNVLKAGIVKALMAMINEEDVYAGCMGGIGRTGIFLAALAKVQIEYRKAKHRAGRGEDPVLYVRKHFIPHAVETREQERYIADLDVTDIVQWLNMTQTAMGMGGLTPARTTSIKVGAGLPTPKQGWIPEEDKIDDPAFDGYKQDWKQRQCNATLDALESDSGSPDSLQTQVWKLEEKVADQQMQLDELSVQAQVNRGRVDGLMRGLDQMSKNLTKPSIRERIRTWLATH